MARLAMDVKRIPQSGRWSVTIRGRHLDLDVDVIPSQHGQALVIHLSRPPRDLGVKSSPTALRAVLVTQTAEGSFAWEPGMAALLPGMVSLIPGTDVAALRASLETDLKNLAPLHPPSTVVT